jgi:hypothetical protein
MVDMIARWIWKVRESLRTGKDSVNLMVMPDFQTKSSPVVSKNCPTAKRPTDFFQIPLVAFASVGEINFHKLIQKYEQLISLPSAACSTATRRPSPRVEGDDRAGAPT